MVRVTKLNGVTNKKFIGKWSEEKSRGNSSVQGNTRPSNYQGRGKDYDFSPTGDNAQVAALLEGSGKRRQGEGQQLGLLEGAGPVRKAKLRSK